MKKKIAAFLLVAVMAFGSFMGLDQFRPEQRSITISGDSIEKVKKAADFQVAARSALVMDVKTGKVLFAQNPQEQLPLASVTKVMTMLLIMEATADGRISMDDVVTVSEEAASMGGSQMYLEPGEKHTVEELMLGVAMVSANDGTVALAEHLCGAEEIFVEKMNEKAKALGMKDTHFANTNGLPAENHYSSAYDIAVMTRALLKHEDIERFLTTEKATVKIGLEGKQKDFEMINTNRLLRQYEGAIGVKTGFTQEAMYCLSGAAEKEGVTLVVSIMGADTSEVRFAEAEKLLNYGFASHEEIVNGWKKELDFIHSKN